MRVTNRMIAKQMLTTISKNQGLAAKLQLDIATTKKVRRPSDDPTGVIQLGRFNALVSRNDQYLKNMSTMDNFLTNSTAALDNALNIVEQAKDIAISGASGVTSDEARVSMANQVDLLIDSMVDIGNSKYNNRNLFAGTLTSGTDSYTRVGDVITYNGNDKSITGTIGFSTDVTYNKTGTEVFNPSGGPDLFATLVALKQGLAGNDVDAVQAELTNIESSKDHLIAVISHLGILQDRLSSTEVMISNQNISFADQISRIQDTDMVATIVNSQVLGNAITTGLRSMGEVIQISLINFIS